MFESLNRWLKHRRYLKKAKRQFNAGEVAFTKSIYSYTSKKTGTRRATVRATLNWHRPSNRTETLSMVLKRRTFKSVDEDSYASWYKTEMLKPVPYSAVRKLEGDFIHELYGTILWDSMPEAEQQEELKKEFETAVAELMNGDK